MPFRTIHLRIGASGYGYITSAGWHALHWPDRVALLWDAQRGIGVRAAQTDDPYVVRRTEMRISLKGFLKALPNEVTRGVRFPGVLDGDTLWFDPRPHDGATGGDEG